MASGIPTFKGALFDRLVADPEIDVDVYYGVPATGMNQSELILLGNTTAQNTSSDSSYSGGQTRWIGGGTSVRITEQYTLDVVVIVQRRWREDQRTDTTERAFAIAALIENSIITWGQAATAYDGACDLALVTSIAHTEGRDSADPPQTRYAAVELTVQVRGTIQY